MVYTKEKYPAYDMGIKGDIFIKDLKGNKYVNSDVMYSMSS